MALMIKYHLASQSLPQLAEEIIQKIGAVLSVDFWRFGDWRDFWKQHGDWASDSRSHNWVATETAKNTPTKIPNSSR